MKKSIIIGTLIALFLVGLVIAIPMPLPVAGEVKIQSLPPPVGAGVTITHVQTGIVLHKTVDYNGFFLFDLGNHGLGDGDYKISVDACYERSECVKTIHVLGDPVKVVFNIDPLTIPADTIYTYVCWDNSKVADASQCPVKAVPVTPPVMKTCEDGSQVPENETCGEKTTQHWLTIVIETLAAIFVLAGGWKFYAGKFKHYHRGLTGYHDPNTRHNNPKYRHTRWNDGAWKCIKECVLIQKGIDLVEYREEQAAQEDE